MIEISGLRKYKVAGGRGVRLEADIKFVDVDADYPASTLYFEIRKRYGAMFSDDTYDAFFLVGLYLAMYHKTPLRIRGNVSKKLYKNANWYIQKILCDFSEELSPVDVIVEGFAPTEIKGVLIGTGISCGVDSLSTVYDRFVRETDPDYKINTLFIFNCGSHGDYGAEHTPIVFESRIKRAMAVSEELSLPLIIVDSNLHCFRHKSDKSTLLFLSFYACVLSLQNAIRRYYMPSGCSYQGIKNCGGKEYHNDLATACDSYLVPLIQSDRTELIVDGCQRRRVDKIADLADWEIARKYLNVCLVQKGADTTNCGICSKCLRTLLTLEILGKLDDFAQVFNVEEYRENSFPYKARCIKNADYGIFYKEIIDLAAEKNFPMPIEKTCYVLEGNVIIPDD